MPSLQIPLDALTSRFSFGDRFSAVRAQSFSSRFANLKPVSEFLDVKRISKPANFGEMQSRLNYNLSYFSSNYIVVFIMLSIYSLLTNLLLLFVILLVIGGTYGIGKLEGRDLDVGVFRATTSQLYTGLLIVAVPLGLWASPLGAALWLIGATGVTVLGHAAFMDKPIENAFSEEATTNMANMRWDEAYQDSTVAYAIQLALKDKEDRLVDRALERIRRAQILGKSKVKLSQRELEALERRRMQGEMSNGSQRGKPSRMRGKIINTKWPPEAAYSSAAETAPGYYNSPLQAPQARPRTPSVQTLRMQQPNTPPRIPGAYHFQDDPSSHPPSTGRVQPLSRPLPDDPQWAPRSRASSNAIPLPHPAYASYVPAQIIGFDPRYSVPPSPRYNLSTAPDAMYQAVYRPASRGSYADNTSSTDATIQPAPATNSVRHVSSSSNASSSDNGVQVETPKATPATNGRKVNGATNGKKSTRGRRTRK
ncbi:conserved hypothetical protein [Uncinocarpus reesii 1704]|uniref:PRA1 family protein n=1 Tax=Uncinocarpus reesii (strain UAMH 1704) TaxID=336963 RepID=C4JXQ5_UNCRE|nr:uncharacterized protein UREG_07843 [Uncinocarpus reesii 1704]EEP82978.1 conserved hypothetical protein [Uncinocarpus reesii 1704]